MKMTMVPVLDTTGLQPHVLVSHLALDLRTRHEGCHRVDDDDVDAARSNEPLGDLERLLSGIGLGDQQIFDSHPQALRIGDVECVLRVDEGGDPAELLSFGDRVERQGRLPRRFLSEDLDDASTRVTADTQRTVETYRAARQTRGRSDGLLVPQSHDCALSKLLLDSSDRCHQCLHLLS